MFKRKINLFLLLSLLGHILVLFPVSRYGSYNFSNPVVQLQAVMVRLDSIHDTPPIHGKVAAAKVAVDSSPMSRNLSRKPLSGLTLPPTATTQPALLRGAVAHRAPAAPVPTLISERTENDAAVEQEQTKPAMARADQQSLQPLRTAAEFTATQQEQLTYRISLLGVSIGTAVLEAKNEKGEVRITLRVKSSPAISAIYPVDDFIETRHIAGNFIITRIRQQEGTFRSDRGFTLFLREKSVFWIDLMHNRSVKEFLPHERILDLMSAFYYLRLRPLEVGKAMVLEVYDSDRHMAVAVEVLRREQIRLPGFRQANAIVIKPDLGDGGIFRRTGDVTIWLTDDEKKVPVRLETSIPLGHITAELVSAQSDAPIPSAPVTTPKPVKAEQRQ